ncbi:hypothetical protein [Novosphingobium cyanobacteriorum]|uniref:Uncharacterized protein n=1 Tax=Novosphingobium cyanobacteriorum TaxID=3024215 RepID=A0ABT6CJ09_9SPHN|nr:hypothetical protein [Novosphingobium cyanobacteriorum]MDF8333514.1 hypothetical protein [Novosphingobium cyanobacteriorum]
MTIDLGKALLRKEEHDSARATEFEFTEMVRALKALAAELGLHPVPMLAVLAERGLPAALAHLGEGAGLLETEIDSRYLRARAHARARLIAERGDPGPVRLG